MSDADSSVKSGVRSIPHVVIDGVEYIPASKSRQKCVVRFTRKNSWPSRIAQTTAEEEIETLVVDLSETRMEKGKRVYDMTCGHGCIITLPVSHDSP
jgi:hypothetical protein